jgi:hypothetical protein
MTKREREDQDRMLARLLALGFTIEEFRALRRISMTLRRWYEAECNGEIERSQDGDGLTYASCPATGQHYIRQIPDRETGACQALDRIMLRQRQRRPGHRQNATSYLQTDPRGCSLYIIPTKDYRAYAKLHAKPGKRLSDTGAAYSLDCCYSSIGIPIY